MKKNQKKIYEQPTANPVEIVMKLSLMADSGKVTNDGYGEAIGEDDPNGWR